MSDEELVFDVRLRVSCEGAEDATRVTEKMLTIMNGHILEGRECSIEVDSYELSKFSFVTEEEEEEEEERE